MQDYRRLLLVAILAWSASAGAVRAENDGAGEPCNTLCRFWLGRSDNRQEAPPPPAAATEALPAVATSPQDQEPEVLPIVRMKRKAAPGSGRPASPPLVLQQIDGPVDGGQGGDVPAVSATASHPMNLTPDEAAEPAPAVGLPPIPPRRMVPRVRQARSKRPMPFGGELPVSLSVAEPRSKHPAAIPARDRLVKTAAPPKLVKPAGMAVVPVARPAAVAVATPVGLAPLPVADAADLRGGLPALPSVSPGPATPSQLDMGSTSVGRTAVMTDPKHLHDVAPGPRPALTADSTATIPTVAKRPDMTDPDQALENLKQTILRSAQEAVRQSDVHGF